MPRDIAGLRRRFGPPAPGGEAAESLPVDAWDAGDSVEVEVDVPEMKHGALSMRTEGPVVTVAVEREAAGRRPARAEAMIGLPGSVDARAMRLRLCRGVLRLSFPKTARNKPG